MKAATFRWDKAKDRWLRSTRGIGFEDVVQAVAEGRALDDIQHPRRSNQRIIVFAANGYVHAAPYVIDGEALFLKTIYPDRILNAKYRKLQ
jgi:uncharacterized DUF497 family protein